MNKYNLVLSFNELMMIYERLILFRPTKDDYSMAYLKIYYRLFHRIRNIIYPKIE